MSLKGSQRDDALAQYKLSGSPKDSTSQYQNTNNVYGRADNYLSSVGAPAAASRLFQDFVASDNNLINGSIYNNQTGRSDPVTVSRAVQMANAYARDHSLSPDQARLLVATTMQAYK
jgi:hypothetical protein